MHIKIKSRDCREWLSKLKGAWHIQNISKVLGNQTIGNLKSERLVGNCQGNLVCQIQVHMSKISYRIARNCRCLSISRAARKVIVEELRSSGESLEKVK